MEREEAVRESLRRLIRERALRFGNFQLASGRQAHYYLDCRQITLDSLGAYLIGSEMLRLLGDPLPHAVGGMAIGADPITGAIITIAGMVGRSISGFIVRKEAKPHGTGLVIEGPVIAGQTAVIVEDVVTSGGSSLKAIDHAEAFGLKIQGVIAIVDRLEGGRESFTSRGYAFQSLFTVRDLGVEPLA